MGAFAPLVLLAFASGNDRRCESKAEESETINSETALKDPGDVI